MKNLHEKLNISIGDDCILRGTVFAYQNKIKRFNCEPSFVEEALNDAGYYAEDGHYNNDDIMTLCEVIDDFGKNAARGEVLSKSIWFDKNLIEFS